MDQQDKPSPYRNEGNLVKPCELKSTQSGKLIAKGVIAVHGRSRTNPSTEAEASFTSFFDFEAWGETAEALAKLGKGDRIVVEGDFSQQRWKNTENKARSAVKLIVQKFTKVVRQQEQPA